MSINLEQLVVGLVFLIPGFISTTAEKVFQPRRFESAYAWTSSSLLRSIGLNALGVVVIIFLSWTGSISDEILTLKIQGIGAYLSQLHLGAVLFYIMALFIFSAIWGSVIGIYPQLTLRTLANKLNLTTLGRHDSVWRRIRDLQRPKDRPYTWIKLHFDNGKSILGRLRHASSKIDQDKPIELFLKPAYEIHQEQICQLSCKGQQVDGVYVRLGIADIVEFYFNSEELPTAFMPDIDA